MRWLLLILCACSGRLEKPERFTTASLAFSCDPSVDVPRDILKPRCATSGCHNTIDRASGLDLESDGAAVRMYGEESNCRKRLLLDTVNPFGGYFYDKLVQDEPACGLRMPNMGGKLTHDELQCLHLYMATEIENAPAAPPL